MEFLDLSHSIFWQQGSSLRSDLGDLREKEPALAENLERVSHQLEAGYFSDNDFSVRGYNVEDARHRVEAIGIECRHMVGNWEELVEQVRRIPQFEYFLRPIPFSRLCRAASGGQVIIINVSEFGVDALIISIDDVIEHVPLPDVNLELLANLSHDIVFQRSINASESQRRKYVTYVLKPALRTIWNQMLIHIFNQIHISHTDPVALPQR